MIESSQLNVNFDVIYYTSGPKMERDGNFLLMINDYSWKLNIIINRN